MLYHVSVKTCIFIMQVDTSYLIYIIEMERSSYYLLPVFLLLLTSGLLEVYSQTFPYISFKGEILPNNSIVILNEVGNADDGSDSIQCHTNVSTCCNVGDGSDRGEWFYPNGLLVEEDRSDRWYIFRTDQRIDLRRRDSGVTFPDRIYRCDIPVNSSGRSVKASIYVGVYSDERRGKPE